MEQLLFRETSGSLPTSTYDFVVDGRGGVGFLQIRHKPSHATDIPPQMASHIYYEINEKERGKGYGARLLALGLKEAKKLGLKEIIITCTEDNLASKKIIERNGGIFQESAIISSTGQTMLKYKNPAFLTHGSIRANLKAMSKFVFRNYQNTQFPLIVEKDEDDFYVVECPLFEGCYSQGKTLDEALQNIREAIRLVLEEKKSREALKTYQPRELSLHTITL